MRVLLILILLMPFACVRDVQDIRADMRNTPPARAEYLR